MGPCVTIKCRHKPGHVLCRRNRRVWQTSTAVAHGVGLAANTRRTSSSSTAADPCLRGSSSVQHQQSSYAIYLAALATAERRNKDGTLSMAPRLFSQLYVIRAEVADPKVTCAYTF